MQDLSSYVAAQERAGFQQEQIRAALLAQGYTAIDIDAAFTKGQTDTVIQGYAQEYARQGMPPVQIFTTLTAQGYPASKVRHAITNVFGPGTMPQHHAFAFLAVAIAVAGAALFFLHPWSIVMPEVEQPTTIGVEFSVSEHIEQITALGRTQGEAPAMKECQLRLRGDNRDMCYLDVAILPNIQDDTLCDQISDVKIRDTCLVNFLATKRANVCSRVKLAENVETCKSLAALSSPSAAAT